MTSVLASTEREADRRGSKDIPPQLSLSLDSPPSSSPFPSPSSSFLPPPMPGAHEFANKLPIPQSKKKQRESTESPTPVATAPTPVAASGPSPAGASAASAPFAQSPQAKRISIASSTQDGSASMINEQRSSIHAKHTSLSSSRRAPLSPSVSRRASGAQNHYTLSRAPSNATNTTTRRRPRSVKIRDFAYPASDARHTGQGPDAPRLGRSRAPSEYEDMNGSNSRRNSGWGAFRWAGSKLWGFALGGGKQRSEDDDPMPTSSDFARNFDAMSPDSEFPSMGLPHSSEDNSEEYDEEDEGEGYPDQDVPLLPGLYRALYAFLPEGTAEMALVEDQVVRIVGRGGGVGWAVAEDEAGNHALVPESYLEVVQLDQESDRDDD